ncbi:hypothetical protein [Butyrivibrio sp.]|uniref:hypothetical protein n=1 Tax=Butyrivibrio sp. TaxID=28121 RepID=UPI0025BD6EBF|nr:hypothetical protein [Butyrivibrio sp.]MBQ9301563.1 hypothetical protein [Butyrivibrio sp.]
MKMNELSIYEVYDLHNSVLRIVTHITDGSEIEEKVVKTMGGQLYELPSVKLQREIAEKYAEIINEKDTAGGTKRAAGRTGAGIIYATRAA